MEFMPKWIGIIEKFTVKFFDEKLASVQLKKGQYGLLFYVYNDPGISQEKLHSMLYLHPSNVSRGLEQLEKNGLIVKNAHKNDKRTSTLFLTKKGEETVNQVQELQDEWFGLLTEGFTQEERQQSRIMLERISKNLKAYL